MMGYPPSGARSANSCHEQKVIDDVIINGQTMIHGLRRWPNCNGMFILSALKVAGNGSWPMITHPYAQKLHGRHDSASGQPLGTHPMPLHMMTKGFACPNLWDGAYSELIGDHISLPTLVPSKSSSLLLFQLDCFICKLQIVTEYLKGF